MIPDNITKEHILQALAEIDTTNNIPWYRESDVYDLLYEEGKRIPPRYPPKYVISVASRLAGNVELKGGDFKPGEMKSFFKKMRMPVILKEGASVPDSIIISKIAWSYNGWSGFDINGYKNRDRYNYAHIKEFGIAHEWWSFYNFGGEYYFSHIETGDRNVLAFKNDGLILITSVNLEKKEYNLIGFFGKAEHGKYSLPSNLWDTLSPEERQTLTDDAESKIIDEKAPDELKERNFFNWQAKKEFSTLFKKFIPFDTKDYGVPVWGRAPYISVGTNPDRFTKDQTRGLLVQALDEHKKLLATSTDQEKTEIETIINKIENVMEMYFDSVVSPINDKNRAYWVIPPLSDNKFERVKVWKMWKDFGTINIMWSKLAKELGSKLLNFTSYDEFTKAYHQVYPGQPDQVWKFIYEMKEGDVILVCLGHQKIIGRGTVRSPAKIYDNTQMDTPETHAFFSDLPIHREVSWEEFSPEVVVPRQISKLCSRGVKRLTKEEYEQIFAKGPIQMENPLFTKIQNILDYKKQVILYGPPGTGKTWAVSNFVDGKKRFEPEVKTITTDKKFFWFSANPSRWDPNNLWKGGETDLWYGSIRSAFNDIEEGDLVFVYVSKDHHRMFGIATCSKKEFDNNNIPKVFLKGIQPIGGPEWSEMKNDSVLSAAKPVRMGARGTLFPLDQYEGLRILEMADVSPESVGISLSEEREKIDNCKFVTFHPSYSYEEFIEGLRPEKDENGNIYYKVQEGLFKKACRTAYNSLLREAGIEREWDADGSVPQLSDDENENVRDIIDQVPVYFVIDEINRGDISRIFGELITLIEADKRLFMDTKIPCTLPYSKQEFGIPPNLYIIGTMNTADRSISLMDIALRRRFGFCELMPDYDTLKNILLKDEKIDPNVGETRTLAINVLKVINNRLLEKYDRDHQIGHSYLMKLSDVETPDAARATLENIWKYEILPLLQEYFFDSPEKLLFVLNDRFYTLNGTSFAEKPEENFIAALQAVAQQKTGN